MTPIVRIEKLHHTFTAADGTTVPALAGVDLAIEAGEYLVILGHNGSGKSTLAKHLNALLLPTQGDVWVKGWNTRDAEHHRAIRATVGMVFQTPDNQIVATIVEEDVAFGPENLGVPRREMLERVEWALTQVDMLPHRHRAPHLLSGGQKQRICIAGVLAMQPAVLVLDESTAMLDPQGRREVLATAHRLNREQGVTVVAITHFMREAIDADRVIVMAGGRIALEGTPHAVFSQPDRLRQLQLDVPPVAELAHRLHARLPAFPAGLLAEDELVDAVRHYLQECGQGNPDPARLPVPSPANGGPPAGAPLIEVSHLAHDYMQGTPLAMRALHDVSLAVYPGEIVGILGHTGSGKSTAVQHLNGLLRAHGGRVTVMGQDLAAPGVDLRAVRRQVGLVFQFPEAQLFERYVGDDIAFGPRRLGLGRDEIRGRVRRAMEAVGLDFEAFKDRQTFALSGGERRRVALAGVLALEPRVLILDEPTAGLDPRGRRRLWQHILDLYAQGITLVVISHNMEELAALCHRLYVIAQGRTVLAGSPATVFAQGEALARMGLEVPAATAILDRLAAAGILPAPVPATTIAQAADVLATWLGG
jgi:energy-coupling factor transport system ATP-binding protein